MSILSLNLLFPYATLGALIASLFAIKSRKTLAILLATQLVFAFAYGIIDPKGLLCVSVFWGICVLHWRHPTSRSWLNFLRLFAIIAAAIAFASHMVPGFHNVRVFRDLLISTSATPFTMYLNFDKTIAAIILVTSSGLFLRQIGPFNLKALVHSLGIAALCISLLAPLALLSGYVVFDAKLPDSFWLWVFNNLYFVCFAEEVIFRGIIQNYLMQIAIRKKLSPWMPIVISAALFATLLPAHFQNGPLFMAFGALAGVFYGYAYYRTSRLESAILVHFLVNLCHYLFFSYPMAANLVK